MNKKHLLLIVILVFIISGCATRSRIGLLIPHHHFSDQRAGETVWLHVVRSKENAQKEKEYHKKISKICTSIEEDKKVTYFAIEAALASVAIGMAIDYIKSELQEEAKSYEASYGAKAWLTTNDVKTIPFNNLDQCIKEKEELKNATNIVLKKGIDKNGEKLTNDAEKALKELLITANTNLKVLQDIKKYNTIEVVISRWVDESPFNAPPPQKNKNDEKGHEDMVNIIKNYAVKNSSVQEIADGSTILFENDDDFDNAIKGKRLAFAYALSLSKDSSVKGSPFLVRPLWKWQWLSKAKVVSFNPVNPLAIPGALLLQTGTEVDYNIRLSIDALVNAKTESGAVIPQMVSLGLKDAIAGPAKHDLTGEKHYIDYTKNQTPPVIGWIAIPEYPASSVGYFSLQLTVNESDPSNVKKTILKGSDYLEQNRSGIIDMLNPSK
ncbi:MAG: hypothetical protein H6936_00200 [Burkholderiales bacterium]|nr:hypothetical protein [Nitrosomonas sp.]MCP5273279.1 hypothetical protein [Burkholderiales bacterium]